MLYDQVRTGMLCANSCSILGGCRLLQVLKFRCLQRYVMFRYMLFVGMRSRPQSAGVTRSTYLVQSMIQDWIFFHGNTALFCVESSIYFLCFSQQVFGGPPFPPVVGLDRIEGSAISINFPHEICPLVEFDAQRMVLL